MRLKRFPMPHQRGKCDSETIIYASPKRKSENEINEKIYKEPNFETAVAIEKQAVEDVKKSSKLN